MTILILGLIGFIGVHLIRVVAEDWRTGVRERYGSKRYELIYSIVALVSFALMVWGYAISRNESTVLWQAPLVWYSVSALVMLASMIALAGFHMPRSHLSVKLRHPMLWSVILLCAGHLLVNGRLVDIVLFSSLLVWSLIDLMSCHQRDVRYAVEYPAPERRATVLNIVLGVVFFAVFAFLLHQPLIGVAPIPSQ